jgi:hypothetical protein
MVLLVVVVVVKHLEPLVRVTMVVLFADSEDQVVVVELVVVVVLVATQTEQAAEVEQAFQYREVL